MLKNTASQKLQIFAFDYSTGAPKTGDAAQLTAYVAKDYGSVTVLADTSATEMDATNAKGWYLFDLAQAETNADSLLFTGKSSTANVTLVGQWIFPEPLSYSGVIDFGTAQSATSTTLVMRSAAAFADSELIGHTVVITGGTTGVGQSRLITANVGSTDTCTVDAWTTTPTGTITYTVIGTPPSSATSYPSVNAVQLGSQTVAAAGTVTFPGTVASTTNITTVGAVSGSVAGSVASVTGNVGGNVVGSVASVVGNVGGNVVGSVASVVGAVGSVTGNVLGNVVGSVASVVAITASGGIVSADVKKANGTSITGVGTVGNPWGPV